MIGRIDMPKNKYAQTRLLAIDQCLHDQSRHYGYKELLNACNEALSRDKGDGLSLRTVQNDLDYLRSSNGYNAEIDEYWINRKKYFKYHDPHFTIAKLPINREEYNILQNLLGVVSYFEGNMCGWMDDLEMHLHGLLHENCGQKIVSFEENPDLRNSHLLRQIFNNIVEKRVIELYYQPFGKTEEKYVVSPYFLKQYNRRWFLLGRINGDALYTFPIDRITRVSEVDSEPYVSADIDFDDYFYDIVGVTRYLDHPVEEILLYVKNTRFPYIDTNPIHPSQKLIHDYKLPEALAEDFVAVSIKVSVNHELINTLLSFGCDVVVASPQTLKDALESNVRASLQNYFHL